MKKHHIHFATSAMLILTALGIYFIGHNELLAGIMAVCAFIEFGLAFMPRRNSE